MTTLSALGIANHPSRVVAKEFTRTNGTPKCVIKFNKSPPITAFGYYAEQLNSRVEVGMVLRTEGYTR